MFLFSREWHWAAEKWRKFIAWNVDFCCIKWFLKLLERWAIVWRHQLLTTFHYWGAVTAQLRGMTRRVWDLHHHIRFVTFAFRNFDHEIVNFFCVFIQRRLWPWSNRSTRLPTTLISLSLEADDGKTAKIPFNQGLAKDVILTAELWSWISGEISLKHVVQCSMWRQGLCVFVKSFKGSEDRILWNICWSW